MVGEKKIYREVLPLTINDCFSIYKREKSYFDYPLHYHDYVELNLVINGSGVRRMVGNHTGILEDMELVIVGPGMPHGWFGHQYDKKNIQEVTIQFHVDLLDDKLLKRKNLERMRMLFSHFDRGLLFPASISKEVAPRIIELAEKTGFTAMIELLTILDILSRTGNYQLLTDCGKPSNRNEYIHERLSLVYEFLNSNFHHSITLPQVADMANMATESFSRFIKAHTGNSFVDILNHIRLNHVERMLLETRLTIAEIAYQCGFNNMANFNRTFKSKKGLTPRAFREKCFDRRIYI
jgi:AraC-like DNA-binding protein